MPRATTILSYLLLTGSLLVCLCIQGYSAQNVVEYFNNNTLPVSCNVHFGVDWFGGDMITNAIEDIDNPGDCCARCERRSGCRAWMWRRDFNHCWLKKKTYPPIECLNCVGGILSHVTTEACESNEGGLNGTNVEVRIGTTIGDCCNACQVTPECDGWTFKNSSSPRCFLKRDTGEATNCTNCRSGIRERPSGRCRTQTGVDWYGFDINGARPYTNSNPEECCDLCHEHPACRAWLFREINGYCFLKAVVSAYASDCEECTGGIIR